MRQVKPRGWHKPCSPRRRPLGAANSAILTVAATSRIPAAGTQHPAAATSPNMPTGRVRMKAFHSTPPKRAPNLPTKVCSGAGKPAATHRAACPAPGTPREQLLCLSRSPGRLLPAAQGAATPPDPGRPGHAAACCCALPQPDRARAVRGERAARRGRDAGGAPGGPAGRGEAEPGARSAASQPRTGGREPLCPSIAPGHPPCPRQLHRPLPASLTDSFTHRHPGESRPLQPRAAGCPRVGHGTCSPGGSLGQPRVV